MTHTNKPSWSDFADEDLGPILPLTDSQMSIPISGILPSGEAGNFDTIQSHNIRGEAQNLQGSGINVPYPYPNSTTDRKYAYTSDDTTTGKFTSGWWEESGILKTYPSDDGQLIDETRESGIFHYDGPKSAFSNGEQVKERQISDFTIFNYYIHHERIPSIVTIPYVSTFRPSIDWNPYG